MRTVLKSKEYEEFYNSLNSKVQEKIKYVLQLVSELTVVNTKFIKKSTKDYKRQIITAREIINKLKEDI